MDPAALLRRHGLPAEGLEPAPGATVQRVWRTRAHVIRLGPADHAREAGHARAALRAGVRTARPVAWGAGYGIWERLAGAPVGTAAPPGVWRALLEDLERLHARPPGRPEAPAEWRGDLGLVARSRPAAGWSPAEERALRAALGRPRPPRPPLFVHGDAHGGNVLVAPGGSYGGLIDWGCAGRACLEAEAARLEDGALALARRRWAGRLDPGLLAAMRLELFLTVALAGRMPYRRVRAALAAGA